MLKNFKLNNKSKHKFQLFSENGAGYTILELMVVVAIISALTAVIIPNFPSTKLSFSLSRAANKFDQDARRAQELALSSNEFKDSNGVPHPVSGYGIYKVSNTEYIIYADDKTGGSGNQKYDAGVDYVVETVDFDLTEPGIVMMSAVNGIHFNPPNPITTFQPNTILYNADIFFVVESDPLKSKNVSIYSTGLIEIK